MIPVLIVLGSAAASVAGLFVGAAATAAAHEVVQESKDELNAINADMQKMTEDANSAIASCKETYSVSMEKFDDARTNAYLSVLPEFTQVMSNIKHTEMGGDITLTQKLSEVDNAVVSCQSNFEYYNQFWSKTGTAFFTTALFGGIGVGLAVFGGLVSNIRLSYKIDEAFDKRNQLKLQIEEINRQCTKVNGVSRRVDTYTKTIIELSKAVKASTSVLQTIIAQYGNDYRMYAVSTREAVRLAVNLAILLSEIVRTPIFNNDGSINDEFIKYVTAGEKQITNGGNSGVCLL